MKELILMITKSLVDNPGELEEDEAKGDKTTVLELKVPREDLGKVIGKKGKTAHAIRTILNETATKMNQRAVLETVE